MFTPLYCPGLLTIWTVALNAQCLMVFHLVFCLCLQVYHRAGVSAGSAVICYLC